MNLNDPFGRMQKRREVEYNSLRDSLRAADVDSIEQAEQIIERIKKRSWIMGGIGVVVALAFIVTVPESAAPVLLVGAIFLFWLINSLRNGEMHLRRYMAEELEPPTADNNAEK